MLNRRAFLSTLTLGSLLQRLSYMAPLGGLLAPSPVRGEPITVALALGAAVAGMIAANNRGSILADYLTAISKKLDVAIEQLSSLQAAVSAVLDKLAGLNTEIDNLFKQDNLRNLRDTVYATAIRYSKLIRIRGEN